MNGKALLLLGMAAACGLAAMIGVRSVLSRPRTSEVPMSEVLVATQEIRVEQTITEEMVATKAIPTDMVPPGSLTDFKQARGRWAMIRMLPGDVVLDGKLAQKGMPAGMIARITPGMRAFAIRVDEQTGVSGFILPDYRVDVLQPRPDQPGRADVVLENVRVLASGTVFESPEDRSIEARTVTLEVTPDQVRTLASAMQKGSLTLALRGLDDNALTVVPPEPEPEPEPVPEPEPEPEPEPPAPTPPPQPPMIVVAPPPEPEPLRRLTFFAGLSRRTHYPIGPKGDRPAEAPAFLGFPDTPEMLGIPEARRPFGLDAIGAAPEAAPTGVPPG